MKIAAAATWVHKWLALIVGIQVLFWFVSGLFFAIAPIERVRSEHRIAELQQAPLDAALTRTDLTPLLPEAPTRVTFERDVLGRAVAVAEFAGRPPALIDLQAGRVISPLPGRAATEIAQAYTTGSPRVREARLVTEESAEYRGALPAWRVAFEDEEGLAVYVAADTGRVAARRSDLWRVYDALWALHIMDWRDHENFNTGVLILTTLTSLILVLAGIVLIPYRFGWLRRRVN